MCFFLIVSSSFGQEKCATALLKQNQRESVDQFESWVQNKIEKPQRFGINSLQKTNSVVKIPVVVHIIHNGEKIGEGVNLSDKQILSQIEVLNEDFRRKNTDAINTPSVFENVAADLEIEFVLALQDPEGLPTDGIVRVKGNKTSWGPFTDSQELSDHSYWPSKDYLNIWVTNLSGGYLGYAQFPVTNLPGMEGSNDNEYTDGVVIDYRAFGSIAKDPNANVDPQFDLGRTTTHEIGHFLGLRHIWGDGGCSQDDYCEDTPSASEENANNSSCTFPGPNSCDEGFNDLPDMFQNYMDYSDDHCMNLFTEDQKERTMVVLSNSPRRASLLTSPGLEEPQLATLDLGIKDIVNPVVATCGTEVQPIIEIRNYGNEDITSYQINFYINGELAESYQQNTNLASLELDTIAFASQPITSFDNTELSFKIVSVNGTTDYAYKNQKGTSVPYFPIRDLPFREDFEAFDPKQWEIKNFDGGKTWKVVTAPSFSSLNLAMATDFFDDEYVGEEDHLISEIFEVPNSETFYLSFYVAYARYGYETSEGLIIKVSDDCGNSFDEIVFEKYGQYLETAAPTAEEFVPSGEEHWRQEIIDLSAYTGKNIRVSFIAVNEFGNNLYLDNIVLTASEITDVELSRIKNPTAAMCDPAISPVLKAKNKGFTNVDSAEISLAINELTTTYTVNFEPALEPGDSIEIDFPSINVVDGLNDIGFNITAVNGEFSDFNSINNHLRRTFLIDKSTESLPVREDFNDFTLSNWKILNLDNDITWETANRNKNTYISFPSTKYFNQKDEDWIVSPVLDFSEVNEASLFFDLYYNGVYNDRLRILYSDDCGVTYKPLGYDKKGSDLRTFTINSDFNQQYLNLKEIIGLPSVRIAFVASGTQGSDIEIDNIEVFLEDNHDPYKLDREVVVHPNPAHDITNITFSLKEKEDIQIMITDQSGRILSKYQFPNTLNQTHQIKMDNLPSGVYFIKVQGQTLQDVKKLVLY